MFTKFTPVDTVACAWSLIWFPILIPLSITPVVFSTTFQGTSLIVWVMFIVFCAVVLAKFSVLLRRFCVELTSFWKKFPPDSTALLTVDVA
ncbi:hypothetical protein IJU97_02210 [bacterium]|nr:hypothetical protein [bacterium]